jgi:hypothetical protein
MKSLGDRCLTVLAARRQCAHHVDIEEAAENQKYGGKSLPEARTRRESA